MSGQEPNNEIYCASYNPSYLLELRSSFWISFFIIFKVIRPHRLHVVTSGHFNLTPTFTSSSSASYCWVQKGEFSIQIFDNNTALIVGFFFLCFLICLGISQNDLTWTPNQIILVVVVLFLNKNGKSYWKVSEISLIQWILFKPNP